ncbi:hypothetical protein IFM89_013958 [Coptis chinensis]|uniref:Uncharacterized protein n=1 Tax=Coptis chinensis TaxID=261450 RepID=A0A835HD55_9MAGN|nr:hypothetical protein IFM89_013958 [Coptis chinensis]
MEDRRIKFKTISKSKSSNSSLETPFLPRLSLKNKPARLASAVLFGINSAIGRSQCPENLGQTEELLDPCLLVTVLDIEEQIADLASSNAENTKVVDLVLLDFPGGLNNLQSYNFIIRGHGGHGQGVKVRRAENKRFCNRPLWIQCQFYGASSWSFGWFHNVLRILICVRHQQIQLPEKVEVKWTKCLEKTPLSILCISHIWCKSLPS